MSPAGGIRDLHFSRGGTHLTFLANENAEFTGAREALPPHQYEVAESEPVQRLAQLDLATRQWRWLTPADTFVYSFDESPDEAHWVVVAAQGSGMSNYWIAELALVDGQGMTTLWKAPRQLAHPRFSPDGKRVAVLHGLMSDEGSDGGDVTVMALADRIPHVLPRALASTATWLEWRSADELIFAGVAGGDCFVARQKLSAKQETLLWRDGSTIMADENVGLAVVGDETAVIHSTLTQPPRVEVGRVGAWKALAPSTGFVAAWGEAQRVVWKSEVGEEDGWLLPPREVAKAKYPLAVLVHGGPSGASTNGWARRWAGLLASQGYFVFMPNPRGSIGRGEAFSEANVKDFGGGDLRDILSGVEAVTQRAPIDEQRIGIVGWSYGGFMAMWAPTQTTRFKAAVAGAGLSDWQSYYGENRINTWMTPYFGGSFYDAPEAYARASAVNFAKNAHAPTLILCSDRDAEVPQGQSFEWWNALRAQGVATKLVVYPGEGHHFRSRNHLDDSILRTLAWFDQYLR